MEEGSNERIIAFIANLMPSYVGERVNGQWCARSLVDGTLILPFHGTEDASDEFVSVLWQGDPGRRTAVLAVYVASLAIARYVELHHIASHSKETRLEMQHMAHHFTVKTGEALVFDEPGSDMMDVLGRAVGRLGEGAVLELLKRAAGF
ncbi:hypothetical protein [Hydrogenophaga sp. BPS33]|uniref:hypothetical protein n=1 Tax=Hydrogenophaga sp. BPS33 TaxID=2651974 RepID=UPI0013204284|nr:hypothetical protein [Hydrogenophaga sp. BPS33]QHE88569.1 hypothetical protein F9K07_28635 [Hydrogenophaga sp. BPS33]